MRDLHRHDVDEPSGHHDKKNKPSTKHHLLYDFIHDKYPEEQNPQIQK